MQTCEGVTQIVKFSRPRQRELVDRVAEQYQLNSNQITIQASNEGELGLLNFRQAIKTGDEPVMALILETVRFPPRASRRMSMYQTKMVRSMQKY